MEKLKGVLFDYGHTLVWFPHYKRDHSVAARNVQKVLQKCGGSVEVSRIRTLIDGIAHRTVVDPEQRKIEVLNRALKQAILQELRK